VNLAKREGVEDPWNPGLVSTAEISTLQLELKYLSQLVDDEIYWEKAEHVRISFHTLTAYDVLRDLNTLPR
jgi:hypothetical protein